MHGKNWDIVWEEAIKAINNIKEDNSHWAPLPTKDATKVVFTRYRGTVKALIAIAKHEEKRGLHMQVILQTTSDAEEQYVLLTAYWKAKGLQWVRKNGRRYNFVRENEQAKIVEMYKQGMPMARIARVLGRPVSTVYYVLKRAELK